MHDTRYARRRVLTPLLLLATSCVVGKDPPAPTPVVAIPGGEFHIGLGDTSELACGGASTKSPTERCDSGKGGSVEAYIEEISFAPRARASVERFAIDAREVTNAQYAYCVEEGACSEPAYRDAAGVEGYHGDPSYDEHPVVWVSWQQAADYCAFVGGELPTEAQWERAARLAPAGGWRTFPWKGEQHVTCRGEDDPGLVVFRDCIGQPRRVSTSQQDRTGMGISDMASNVSEWVKDGWNPYAYCEGAEGYEKSCQQLGAGCKRCAEDGASCATGCGGLVALCAGGIYSFTEVASVERVVRGGSYLRDRCFHRLYVRRRGTAAEEDVGFRCVRAPTP